MSRTRLPIIRRKRVEKTENGTEVSASRQDAAFYRNGGEGMIKWCEDFVYVPVYPEGRDIADWIRLGELPRQKSKKTNKSYWDLWENEKAVFRRALEMENGRFKNRLLVFCWMRGEGKSLAACLIQLWKFFCWPRQSIMLGANSKDQVKFVHYDIIRDIILHSPALLDQVGMKNIQEKEIHFKRKGKADSLIRSISSFSGIVSNITGFTFSEIFDMKNPKFFVQLYGSIRNMPNSLGVIDSTVSDKKHVLYQLYTSVMDKKTENVFFSYRCSHTGAMEDYWNPNMDQSQLNDYKVTFPFGEFERYFLNLWSAGTARVFTEQMIEEMSIVSCDGILMNHDGIQKVLDEKVKLTNYKIDLEQKNFMDSIGVIDEKMDSLAVRVKPVSSVYRLKDGYSLSRMATIEDLDRLSQLFDTDWCVCGGVDMADPMAVRSAARTMFCVVAKGLVGSRSNPWVMPMEGANPEYIYFLLYAISIEDHSLETLKNIMDEVNNEFDSMDCLCGERWGIWDLSDWCLDRDILFEAVYPTYDRQREAFKELFVSVSKGRFKAPELALAGSKSEDILREEMGIFDHDTDKRWFGSPEKGEKYGIQDDCIYSVAWSMYGARMIGPDKFRMRSRKMSFGMFLPDSGITGSY